jgi:SAM-dependent methyltransferase
VVQAFLRRYARGEAAAVTPSVVGARVLDLGAGEGYVAPALVRRRGGWACSCDVGPFRRAPGAYVVYDGTRLPFRDDTFDTTLILLTLHHCDDPARVLDEALRVTRRRLIVVESVFRNRLERFWLDRLDGRLNARRHGGAMLPASGFRTPEGWRALFASRGLRAVETRWLGPWWERLVHHPALFVLEIPRSVLHDLVEDGGLAEAAQGVGGQVAVHLAQAQVDLAVGQGEEAAARAVALDQERTQPLDFQHP